MGLLSTGTNCLAAVGVKGRGRVPLPPLKIKPLKTGIPQPEVFGQKLDCNYLNNLIRVFSYGVRAEDEQ